MRGGTPKSTPARVCMGFQEHYTVISNREVGLVRADLLLLPRAPLGLKPSIILEFKACKDPSHLPRLAEEALAQVVSRRHSAPITGPVYAMGKAFCGKQMAYRYEKS